MRGAVARARELAESSAPLETSCGASSAEGMKPPAGSDTDCEHSNGSSQCVRRASHFSDMRRLHEALGSRIMHAGRVMKIRTRARTSIAV